MMLLIEYSIEPKANPFRYSVRHWQRVHLWIIILKCENCPKVHREFSIKTTANPVRGSVGRWQVSLFVDCNTR